MKKRMLAILVTMSVLITSCAVFVYEDETPRHDDKDSDTLIIITHESPSPL